MNKDAQGRWKVGMSNIKLKMRVRLRSLSPRGLDSRVGRSRILVAVIPFIFRLVRLLNLALPSRRGLILENLALRQQLAIYKRNAKRPRMVPKLERPAASKANALRVGERRSLVRRFVGAEIRSSANGECAPSR